MIINSFTEENERSAGTLQLIDLVPYKQLNRSSNEEKFVKPITKQIAKRTITVMIGSNGAGKSTLLEIIAGLHIPNTGTVIWDGQELYPQKKRKRHVNRKLMHNITLSMQHSFSSWSCSTIQKEWELQLKPSVDNGTIKVNQMQTYIYNGMKLMGLEHVPLEKDPVELSGGEQKRLSLAIAFSIQSPLLLLDEPLAGLDQKGKTYFFQALKQYKQSNGTIIIVSHQLEGLIELADEVIQLNKEGLSTVSKNALQQMSIAPDELRFQYMMNERMNEKSLPTSSVKPEKIPPSVENMETQTMIKYHYDPRMIFLCLLISSSTILYGQSWLILIGYFIMLLLLFKLLHLNWSKYTSIMKSMLLLVVLISLVGGFEMNPLSLNVTKAVDVCYTMCQWSVMLLLSLPIMEWISPFRLQKGIVQTFGFMKKWKVPIDRFALLTTLMIRFIPILHIEWLQQVKLAKAKLKLGNIWSIEALRAIFIPFVRSIFNRTDKLAYSLEIRGFQQPLALSHSSYKLRFSKGDYIMLTCTIMFAIIILSIDLIV